MQVVVFRSIFNRGIRIRKIALLILLVILLSVNICAQEKHNFRPKKGYVPDETTAIKIAEAVLLATYGDSIHAEKPFKAILKDGVWLIEGSLPNGRLGGVAEIEIDRDDGRVLRVSHGK